MAIGSSTGALARDHGHEFGADAVEQAGGVLGLASLVSHPRSI
jgi:hypothetical protein